MDSSEVFLSPGQMWKECIEHLEKLQHNGLELSSWGLKVLKPKIVTSIVFAGEISFVFSGVSVTYHHNSSHWFGKHIALMVDIWILQIFFILSFTL